MKKYGIIVASKDHVTQGVYLGIAPVSHGKRSRLAHMHKGDMIVYYSPRGGFEALHAFTAIGELAYEDIFQVEETEDFKPFRRKVRYMKNGEVRIEPLVEDFTFIRNKKSWGYAFGYGVLQIHIDDFDRIREKFPTEL